MKKLPLIPDAVLAAATPVKANANRRVLRCGDLFLKVDRRGPRRLLAEAKSAALLQSCGIPVTEVLYTGRTADGSGVLATRAFPGIPVTEYLFRHGATETFCTRFAAFLKKVFESGIRHPDFHTGNLLCREETLEFCLVDVYGVRRRRWFDGRYATRRVLMDLRNDLPPEKLLEVARDAGIGDPQKFYAQGLLKEAARLRHEWPRRQKQIAADYPKFVRRSGEWRECALPFVRQEAGTERVFAAEQAETVFLAHFYLTLAGVVHRNVLARSVTSPQTLRLSDAPPAFPPPAEAIALLPEWVLSAADVLLN